MSKKLKKTILYLVMVPLVLLLLVRVSSSTTTEYAAPSSEVRSTPRPGESQEVQPTAEVVWIYP